MFIERRQQAFARCVPAGRVGFGFDAQLAQFADVPILQIGFMPEIDRFLRPEFFLSCSIRVKQPLTDHGAASRRFGENQVEHDVIRVDVQ